MSTRPKPGKLTLPDQESALGYIVAQFACVALSALVSYTLSLVTEGGADEPLPCMQAAIDTFGSEGFLETGSEER